MRRSCSWEADAVSVLGHVEVEVESLAAPPFLDPFFVVMLNEGRVVEVAEQQ